MFKSVRLKKLTSILLIYVLFIQQFIPFAQAIGQLKLPISFKSETYFISNNEEVEGSVITNNMVPNYKSKSLKVKNNKVAITEQETSKNFSSVVTSSGGQGDVSGFTISSTDGMVNKFTGDFTYAIPLMDVEGFPISINYNSNVGMNTEASWVGLGWDLSIGGVSREMRGLPDDFNGEQTINRVHSQRKDETTDGWRAGVFAGYTYNKFKKNNRTLSAQATALIGGYHNSYLGNGTTFDFGVQSKYSIGDKKYFAPKFGVGFSIDTKNGIGKSSMIGLESGYTKKNGILLAQGLNYGSSSNSRVGVQARTFDLYAAKLASYENDFILKSKFGTGTTISYGSITSIPRVMFNEVGTSSNFNSSIYYGNFVEKGTYYIGIAGGTYNSENTLLSKNMTQPAIGYLHLGKADVYNSIQDGPILDFNRSSEYAYSEEMSNLPFSIQTFDFFHVSGLGISGTFRAFRTDVTDYGDANRKMQMDGGIGEVAVGFETDVDDQTISLTVEGGISTAVIKSGNEADNWQSSFEAESNTANVKFDNQVYFKSVGEPTQNPENLFTTLGGIAPSKFNVVSNNSTKYIGLTNNLTTNNTPLVINPSIINSLDSKPYSANIFEPKIASDLTGSDAFYYSKNLNSFINSSQQQLTRVSLIRKGNHISKLAAISTDGMIYQFGIPSYSIFTDEVLLSTNNTSINTSTGIIHYDVNDNSVNNNKGLSNLYDRTTVPAYANSFLLTEMYSSDYIDRTLNGPSNDDIGSYFKFNYTQVYGEKNLTQGNYKWRFPMGEVGREAMLNRGFEGTEIDNTAYYTYGEKEVWYNHSIESKNFIAEFTIENREDAYGVNGDDGVLNLNQPLKRLQKIVLYNKSDRLQNGEAAIPIQTVEFIYDYSLCKKNPANQYSYGTNADYSKSGKLTLKSIKITSGNSTEMGEQTIDFTYGGANPDFNYANVDGWGNYKLNSSTKPTDVNPYSVQDAATANLNSSAWKLTKITNPLEGITELEYEADTYEYVQDKRAMNHVDIYKMTNLIQFLYLNTQNTWNGSAYVSNNFTTNLSLINLAAFFNGVNLSFGGQQMSTFFNLLFADNSIEGGAKYTSKFGKFVPHLVPNNVIIFPLGKTISGNVSKEDAGLQVKNDYFKDANGYLSELFFRTHVKVKTENGIELKELVQSIAMISQDEINPFNNQLPYQDDFKAIGVMPKNPISGNYEYGYVVVDPVNSGSSEFKSIGNNGEDNSDKGGSLLMHPIQRSAVDYVRQNLPDKVYGSCDGCDTDLSIDWKYFFGGDIYKFMIDKGGYAQSFYNDYSTVKLYDHDFKKYASSSRVKSITYRDNWSAISGETSGVYKWNYFYEGRFNSYGVSSFEPLNCKDENPLYTWDRYIDIKKKFPDETKFTTTPNAEALYPTPVIGYSHVEVTFEGVKDYGKTITSYYTAHDFPVQEFKTELGNPEKVKKHNPLTGSSTEKFGFSQGFSVVTNDFHGQIKEIRLLDKGGNTISRSTYTYYGLDEAIPVIDRKGVVTKSKVGFEYDVHSDTRFVEDNSKMWSLGLSLNVRATTSFGIPVPAYLFYMTPSYFTTQRTRNFYSSTVVKHINYSARVKSVETQEMMSINTAENLLYDKYTGNVLLSSLKDEFNDKLYSFSYPSHWYYKELRDINGAGSFSAQGTLSQGYFSLNNTSIDLTEYLVQGDLISVSNGTTTTNGYVLTINPNGARIINIDGSSFNGLSGGTLTLALVKTNRDNRLNETMQTVVTKKAVSASVGNFVFPENEIISSSALSYDNRNNVRCTASTHDKMNNEVLINSVLNPFLLGVKGDIKVDKQWAWQSERINDQHAHGIRFDGAYSTYVPYYKMNSTDKRWYTLNESLHPNYVGGTEPFIKWRAMGEVNLYDEYGKALESKDQIDVVSSVLYGYNSGYQLVPIAQAVNAGQQDIAFDGFEDYNYYSTSNFNLSESHFDFKSLLTSNITVDNVERHSGLSSLKLTGPTSATVSKKLGSQCENVGDGIVSGTFVAQECLCIKPFEPRPGEYLVGLWVKESGSSIPETYSNAKVTVKIKNGSTIVSTQTFVASGNIIDGWQRIEGSFVIPENPAAPGTPLNATTIEVSLVNAGSGSAYFDDVRLQPYLAGMTTVVYDPKTLLPIATHDGYNFTTFYNYDENLNSVRVRVETSEGIKTVSESEFGNKR